MPCYRCSPRPFAFSGYLVQVAVAFATAPGLMTARTLCPGLAKVAGIKESASSACAVLSKSRSTFPPTGDRRFPGSVVAFAFVFRFRTVAE